LQQRLGRAVGERTHALAAAGGEDHGGLGGCGLYQEACSIYWLRIRRNALMFLRSSQS
jgi:hypothetical protein